MKTIVLVHGMWGSPEQWQCWKKDFEGAGYNVVTVTLAGHEQGKSPDRLSVHDYIQQVRRVIREIGPCILIGHSMGGVIVQKVAELEEDVEKVVIITSGAPKGIIGLTLNIFFRVIKNPLYIRAMLTGKAFSLSGKDARALMMNCLDGSFQPEKIFITKESGKAAREMALGMIDVKPITRCPSLVVGGIHDNMTPIRIQRAIAALHDSNIIEFDGGHMPMIEKCAPWLAMRMIEWFQVA